MCDITSAWTSWAAYTDRWGLMFLMLWKVEVQERAAIGSTKNIITINTTKFLTDINGDNIDDPSYTEMSSWPGIKRGSTGDDDSTWLSWHWSIQKFKLWLWCPLRRKSGRVACHPCNNGRSDCMFRGDVSQSSVQISVLNLEAQKMLRWSAHQDNWTSLPNR